MGWIMSQDGTKLVLANEIIMEDNTIFVNGNIMGRYAILSDAMCQMRSIERWLENGGTGVFQLYQE